jgi:hypothetical protein
VAAVGRFLASEFFPKAIGRFATLAEEKPIAQEFNPLM